MTASSDKFNEAAEAEMKAVKKLGGGPLMKAHGQAFQRTQEWEGRRVGPKGKSRDEGHQGRPRTNRESREQGHRERQEASRVNKHVRTSRLIPLICHLSCHADASYQIYPIITLLSTSKTKRLCCGTFHYSIFTSFKK